MNEDTTAPAQAEPDESMVAPPPAAESAQAESQAPVEEVPAESATAPEEEETAEEIDLEGFQRERYAPTPAPQAQAPTNSASELAKELANLPADETGTVSAETAAKWFAEKLEQNSSQLKSQISSVARTEAMGIVAETAQQQQLLKKYPDITKDKGTLEMVFDLRDAAALRGQTLTLAQAADKLAQQRREARSEGEDSARRRTTVQAATHLEASSRRGQTQNESKRELASKAFHGSGVEAKEARRKFLTGFVQREVEAGRIQIS